jgi:protein involved in polysaccharide export with SLBB domain
MTGMDNATMRKFFLRLGILHSLALTLVGCQHQDSAPGVVPPPRIPEAGVSTATNQVLIGEALELFVMEDSEFNGNYVVRERGDIILPKIGRLQVAGKSVEEVQTLVKKTLEASQLKMATVIVDRVRKVQGQSFEQMPKMLVYVVGSVARPGQHLLTMTRGAPIYSYDAILIAGGLNQFADERGAYILRRSSGGERVKIPIDLRALRQGTGKDVELGEGDMVFVPQRKFMF